MSMLPYITKLSTSVIPESFIDDIFNDIVNTFDKKANLSHVGLSTVIKRPHNLIVEKNKDGDIINYILELVYTPFKKEDIKVDVSDNTLTIQIDSIKTPQLDSTNIVYRGISSQGISFKLKIIEDIDVKNIKATAEDGVLKITLPVSEKNVPEKINIKVK